MGPGFGCGRKLVQAAHDVEGRRDGGCSETAAEKVRRVCVDWIVRSEPAGQRVPNTGQPASQRTRECGGQVDLPAQHPWVGPRCDLAERHTHPQPDAGELEARLMVGALLPRCCA